MKRFLVLLALAVLLLASPALSQQGPSPMEQAIGTKLMQEINISLSCGASLITIKEQLTAAQARVKMLEDQYEPKK